MNNIAFFCRLESIRGTRAHY